MGDGYNGWENYPTWCVHLWMTNEEGLYEDCRRIAKHYPQNRYEVAEHVKGFVEELPDVTAVTDRASFVCDLLGYALGQVNWTEIADAFIEDEEADRA